MGSNKLMRVTLMKQMRILLMLAILIFTVAASGQATNTAAASSAPQAQQSQQPPPTIASTVDREITTIEKEIVEAAEAMPEDKFNFSPESLNIPGSEYKGVRTFA
jgi:Skp family chaperone for outer membrane proteins